MSDITSGCLYPVDAAIMLAFMSPIAPPVAQAVIFDLHGLLLDTEPIYMDATRTVLARRNTELDTNLWWRLSGQPGLMVLRGIVEETGLTVRAEQLLAERQMVLDRHLGHAVPFPGAESLITRLASAGIPIAIATSSTRRAFLIEARKHPWLELFDVVVTRDEVRRAKPAPDVLLEAARQLEKAPSRCVAVDNDPSGIEAGRAAGMTTVVVPTGGMNHEVVDHADHVLDRLEGFEPAHWGLLSNS